MDRTLKVSVTALVLLGLLLASPVSPQSGLLRFLCVVGIGTALIFTIFVLSCPQYVRFLVLGTSAETLLWEPQTWENITPLLDKIVAVTPEGASIVWFPPGTNTSRENKWSLDSNRKWTAAAISESTFSNTYIYCPPRRSLLGKKMRLNFYVRVASFGPFEGATTRCNQYCLLLFRQDFYNRFQREITELVTCIAKTIASPILARGTSRMEGLAAFESGSFVPIYYGVHLAEIPDLRKTKVSWITEAV